MHGLTGGSWKRDTRPVTATEKNDQWETIRSTWLHRLPPGEVTAPALDPPRHSTVLSMRLSAGQVFRARGSTKRCACVQR